MLDINKNSVIEKIYTTRGDNVYEDGVKCDKAIGIVIEGKIHWLDKSFSTPRTLSTAVMSYGISMNDKGYWGVIDENGSAILEHKLTKISKHHDDVFSNESGYIKRAKRNSEGSFWWKPAEIFSTYPQLTLPKYLCRNF